MTTKAATNRLFIACCIFAGSIFLAIGFFFPPLALLAPCLAADISCKARRRSTLVLALVVACCWSAGAIIGAVFFFMSHT